MAELLKVRCPSAQCGWTGEGDPALVFRGQGCPLCKVALVAVPAVPALKPLHFLSSPLTPASAQDYEHRLQQHTRALEEAFSVLSNAWDARNDARWGGRNNNPCVRDMRPADHPLVLEAEAKIAPARERWYAAHEALRTFLAQPLELRCGVSDWRGGRISSVRCSLPAAHDGRHDFESELHVERTPA